MSTGLLPKVRLSESEKDQNIKIFPNLNCEIVIDNLYARGVAVLNNSDILPFAKKGVFSQQHVVAKVFDYLTDNTLTYHRGNDPQFNLLVKGTFKLISQTSKNGNRTYLSEFLGIKLLRPLNLLIKKEKDLFFVESIELDLVDFGETEDEALVNIRDYIISNIDLMKSTSDTEKHHSLLEIEKKYKEYFEF
ncbi:hypothetical protein [Leptospira levettii]|uniref:hypothetical protein n=1 Tax=Leptospira levettii TaxID=2023178 RepID=UPI00223E18F5|nr:hypothetical protein [Leptospira levettii]MCW7475540.1 hypothetical protein [Leptospira levettii]